MDPIRRKILKAGAVATAMAATPRVFTQQAEQGGAGMSVYERGPVRITYEESGSGFPLLLIAGGGLNSTMARLITSPFNPIAEFSDEYRCIYADLRNANDGESSGPLEIDRPWDSYADDHLGLMDHLGIDKFMVLGFCIAGPFIWNLMERAPDRVVAAVPAQPVGFDPDMPDVMYDLSLRGWAQTLVERRPEVTMEMADQFLTRMFRTDADFVFTVTRDFVRTCQTPVLILPDDSAAHFYGAAMEAAMLAPKAELSMFPWKVPTELIPLAVRQVRSFLRAHRPAA
ncbi:MAG: alpha/beta hydrolase [Gemmatimonadetes bacterium]|nr:alpha/beta hydrolase [Gemmatimonadota bacterium]